MRILRRLLAAGASALALLGAAHASADPEMNIFIDGGLVSRALVVGDPQNWAVQLPNLVGRSAGGKVTVEPAVAADKNPALRVTFSSSKEHGYLAMFGGAYDYAKRGDSLALSFELRLVEPPSGNFELAMDCGFPCRGTVPLTQELVDRPLERWFTMVVPLNCFRGKQWDLKKIEGPFMLQGTGRMKFDLGDVRLTTVKPGSYSCGVE